MSSLIKQGGHYEWLISNGATTYSNANIMSGTIVDGYYQKLGIGNAIARQLNLKLWNVSLDTSQPIRLRVNKIAADGTITTVPKGYYYIDNVGTSPYSEYCEVTAFDALLKADIPYMRTGTFVATTDYAIALQIASDIGVSLENGTEAVLSASPITIDEVPSVGDNGTTDREMLSVIGCLRGGNWIINDDNELQLVALDGLYDRYAEVVYVDSDGDLAGKPYNALVSTDSVVSFDANGDFDVILFSAVTGSTKLWYIDTDGMFYADTWTNIQAIAPDDPNQTIVIGDEVVSFDVSPTETIKRVEVWSGSSKSYRSPSGLTDAQWEAEGGVILSCSMPIMASQTLADALYTLYNGFTYIPYKANETYFDPDTELGTKLTIKNDTVVLSQRTLNVDVLASCDLEAGETAKVVSYYPYVSPVEREIKQDVAEAYTRITLNEESITAEATKRSEEDGYLSSLIQQTADEITISFTQGIQAAEDAASTELADYADLIEQYIRFVGASIELGESNSQFKALLTTTRLSFTGADGQEAAWFSNNELHINRAIIEETFSIGRWVQQEESNGSFSILYV